MPSNVPMPLYSVARLLTLVIIFPKSLILAAVIKAVPFRILIFSEPCLSTKLILRSRFVSLSTLGATRLNMDKGMDNVKFIISLLEMLVIFELLTFKS